MMDRSTAIDLAASAYGELGHDTAPEHLGARPVTGGWRCWQTSHGDLLGALHVLVRDDGVLTHCPAAASDDAAAAALASAG